MPTCPPLCSGSKARLRFVPDPNPHLALILMHGRISDLSYYEDGDKPSPGCLTQDVPYIGEVGYQTPSPGSYNPLDGDHRLPIRNSTTEEDYQVPYSIPYNPLNHRLPTGCPREESAASHSSGGHHSEPSHVNHGHHFRDTAPGGKSTEGSAAHSPGAAPGKRVTEGSAAHTAMTQRPSEFVGDETDRSGRKRRLFGGLSG